jgi:hypothetical protein
MIREEAREGMREGGINRGGGKEDDDEENREGRRSRPAQNFRLEMPECGN